MSEPGSIAVVIVTYDSRDEIEACLASVIGHSGRGKTEIVVVDNGSRDGTPDLIRARWPAVRVLDPGGNVGFARANNHGIRATSSEYVLLLNPDTIVRPGAISALIDTLERTPQAAAAGPRLIDASGRPELSFGWDIGPLGELRQRALGALYARDVRWAVRLVERWCRTGGPRNWLSGACLLIRRADLDAVSLLDERFFMYTEDVDLCVRLRARGRQVLFVPAAEVVHLRGRSAGRNPATERLRRRSQLAYYAKHHPMWVPLLRGYLRLVGKLPRGG